VDAEELQPEVEAKVGNISISLSKQRFEVAKHAGSNQVEKISGRACANLILTCNLKQASLVMRAKGNATVKITRMMVIFSHKQEDWFEVSEIGFKVV